MNIDNISEGQIFKNYKHLCQELNEKVKTGKSKILQLEDWERYFSYSKDGNKFIITEIYDIPEIKIDLRIYGNNLLPHAQNMEHALMCLLDSKEDKKLSSTINRLLKDMNMVNYNFKYGIRNRRKVSKYLNIDESYIEEFFTIVKRTLTSNIESMLDRLKLQGFINWNMVKMVCVAVATTETNELGNAKINSEIVTDEYGNEEIKLSIKSNEVLEFRPATIEEEYIISIVEDKVMEDLGCENKQEIVVKEMWNVFRKRVNEILKERVNIQFHYNSYEISKNELADTALKANISYNLNHDIHEQLLTNLKRRRIKAIETGKGNNIRKTDEYIKNGIILIQTFIDTSKEYIVEDLKQTKIINNIKKLSL